YLAVVVCRIAADPVAKSGDHTGGVRLEPAFDGKLVRCQNLLGREGHAGVRAAEPGGPIRVANDGTSRPSSRSRASLGVVRAAPIQQSSTRLTETPILQRFSVQHGARVIT